jgi:hypothetical protein
MASYRFKLRSLLSNLVGGLESERSALNSVFKGIEAARPIPNAQALIGRSLKEFKHASASQISTWTDCPSKWWLEKIAGFRQPESPAQKLGTDTHTDLERFELDGTAPGPIAAAGIHRLPDPPVAPALVEAAFALVDPEMPVPVVGKIDLIEPERKRITDHKTTSDFKYCKSPEQLKHDTQASIYPLAAVNLLFGVETATGDVYKSRDDYPIMRPVFDGFDSVTFRHVYYRTKGVHKSQESECDFTAAELRQRWTDIVRPAVVKMYEDAQKTNLRDVDHNLKSCGNYGGCYFRSLCAEIGRNPQQLGAKPLGLFTKKPVETTPKDPAPAPVSLKPTINPPDGVPDGVEYKPPAPARKESDPVVLDGFDLPKEFVGRRLKSLKKPEFETLYPVLRQRLAQSNLVEPWTKETAIPFTSLGNITGNKRTDLREDSILIQNLLTSEAVEAVEAVEAPADDRVKRIVEAIATPAEAIATPAETMKKEKIEPPASVASTWLFVDCAPRRDGLVYLSDILRPLMVEAAEEMDVVNYRVPKYKRGEDHVVALLESRIESGAIKLPEFLVCQTRLPATASCLEVLAPKYNFVVDSFGW